MNKAAAILKPFAFHIVGGIVLLIVVLVVIKKTRKGIANFFTDENRSELEKLQETNIKNITTSSANLSFDNTYYTTWAGKLYNAMYGWAPFIASRFSEEDYAELGALNADELKKIVKEFGVKEKSNWMGLHHQLTGTLFDWFENELSGSELQRMRDIFRKTGLWG